MAVMQLYGFRYSPYARKISAALDLVRAPYTWIEVPYSDRDALATLTGGYIHVPVLQRDDGQVICDSRRIAEHLTRDPTIAATLVPAPLDGPIWAYHDWCDGPLEDVLFRVASPLIRDQWQRPGERALYVLIKERKFGPGCVDEWQTRRDELLARANALLAPTERTLRAQPFLFGAAPTLADAALSGQFAMLEAADPALLRRFPAALGDWLGRFRQSIA